jgi:methyl coenzyme M reductase subunit D
MDGGASQAFDFICVAGTRFPVHIVFGPAWGAPVEAMGAR